MSVDKSTGQKAANSAIYVGMSQATKLVLTTLSTIVVSRILTPSDYGVIAMAAPITAFILLFQDLGLSQATIQAKEVTSEQSNSLFWINVSASTALTIVLVAISPLVGLFYGDIRAGYITAASAINILIAGSALQHSALLNRDMRFGSIAMVDIANVSVTFFVTTAAAIVLKSYWAIWLGTLCGTIAAATLLWRSSGWRPGWRPSYKGAGAMARFGGNVTGFNLVNFVSRSADNVLIAKFAGAAQLGLYDRSYKLMMLPLSNISQPLARVMLPTLRRVRDDDAAYRRAFLTAVRALMIATIPGIAVTIATSDKLVPFLLGNKWAAASPIFFWLSLTGLVQPLSNATGWLFISSGRAHEQLRWGLFSAVVTIAGFIIGLPYGATGVAASLFITATARVPILYWYSVKGTSVRSGDLYRSMAEPIVGAVISVALITVMSDLLPVGPLLIAGLILSYSLTVALCLVTKDGRMLLGTLKRLVTTALTGAINKATKRGRKESANG